MTSMTGMTIAELEALDAQHDYPYYVVKYGRKPGIYLSLSSMLEQVVGYNNPEFWMCHEIVDAELYLDRNLRFKLGISEAEIRYIPTYKHQYAKVVYGTNVELANNPQVRLPKSTTPKIEYAPGIRRNTFLPPSPYAIHERVLATPDQVIIPDKFL
jgi:hypothetical protein